MNRLFVRAAIVAGLMIAAAPAFTAEPPRDAIPVLAGEMHSAQIQRIAVDRDGRYVISGSYDRTVRVWSLADGKLVRVLRPPIGLTADEGKIYAVAISADGKLIAAGGSTGYEWNGSYSIYLFDRESGQLVRRIGGMPEVINHLAFSMDDRYLAASLGGANGIRVFRLPEGELAAEDKGYDDASYRVSWLSDGGLVSTSWDGQVRRYDAAFKLALDPRKAPGGSRPYSVAVSPDGRRLAVGYNDSVRVDVLATGDLSLLYSADTQGIDNGSLSSVSWLSGGERLCAGGRYDLDGDSPIVCWDRAGRGPRSLLSARRSTLMGLHPLPGDAVVWGSQDPALGVREADGQARWAQGPDGGDYRGARLLVNQDGSGVQVDLSEGREPHRFVLGAGEVIAALDDAPGFASPRRSAPGLALTNWNNVYAPKLNGQALRLDQYETSRALAIGPRAEQFVLGTEWYLRLFDAKGNQLSKADTPGVAWAVNISGDGRYVVAAFSDGTIRWYGLPKLDQRLALYVRRSDLAWVAWTPQGFFDAGKGGERLIGYQLNQRADQEGVLVRSEQLAEQFRRADLINRALTEEGQARIAEAARRLGDVRSVLAAGLPPVVEILSPAGLQAGRDFVLDLKVTDRGGGVGRIEYYVNGRLVEQVELRGELPRLPGQAPGTIRRPLSLSQGDNEVAVRVANERSVWSELKSLKRSVSAPERNPTLWVITVGITDYQEDSLKLKFPARDSVDFEKTMRATARKIYGENIRVIALRDREATRDRLRAAFRDVREKIRPEDTFIVHLAGHGMTYNGRYHFLPVDAVHRNRQSLVDSSLGYTELRGLMANRATKSLVLLDTCDAGAFVLGDAGVVKLQEVRAGGIKDAMEQLSSAIGSHVIGASASISQGGVDNHGVFTYALLEGLRGKAADGGVVTVGSLATYLDREVVELSRGLGFMQRPVNRLEGNLFPVSIPE